MTPERAAELLGQVTYRPGWTFQARTPPFGDPRDREVLTFAIRARVPDAETGRVGRVEHLHQVLIGPLQDDEQGCELFAQQVFECLLRVERHEAGEYFKFAGAKPFDPHRI